MTKHRFGAKLKNNLWDSNNVDLSGALFTQNSQYEDGAREVNNIRVLTRNHVVLIKEIPSSQIKCQKFGESMCDETISIQSWR